MRRRIGRRKPVSLFLKREPKDNHACCRDAGSWTPEIIRQEHQAQEGRRTDREGIRNRNSLGGGFPGDHSLVTFIWLFETVDNRSANQELTAGSTQTDASDFPSSTPTRLHLRFGARASQPRYPRLMTRRNRPRDPRPFRPANRRPMPSMISRTRPSRSSSRVRRVRRYVRSASGENHCCAVSRLALETGASSRPADTSSRHPNTQ